MRSIRRYAIESDGQPHTFSLCYDPIFVAPGQTSDHLYFWAEHSDDKEEYDAILQVVADGNPLPEQYLWLGSVVRATPGEAVHLIALPPPHVPFRITDLIEEYSMHRAGPPGAKDPRQRSSRLRLPSAVHHLIEKLEKPGAKGLCPASAAGCHGTPVREGGLSRSRPAGCRLSAAMSAGRK